MTEKSERYRVDVDGGHWYKFQARDDAEAFEKGRSFVGLNTGGKLFRYDNRGGEVLVKSFSHQPSLAAATGR